MDKPFAMFSRFRIHDIDRHLVDDVKPTRICDTARQLGRFNWRAPNMLDAWMVQAGPKSKPDSWVWNALHNGLRELLDLDRNVVLGNQAAEQFEEEQMYAEHRL